MKGQLKVEAMVALMKIWDAEFLFKKLEAEFTNPQLQLFAEMMKPIILATIFSDADFPE